MCFERRICCQRVWVNGMLVDAASVRQQRAEADARKDDVCSEVLAFLEAWFSEDEDMVVQTSGSTGAPKRMRVRKVAMMNSACRTCAFLQLKRGDSLLLGMNLKYIGAQMMVVRALVAGMRLVVCAPSAHPLANLTEPVDFLSMVPLQLAASLKQDAERQWLQAARVVIVGGGAVDASLEEELQHIAARVYSTYGMTETLSHIALRRLNGPHRSERYLPLPGVQLSLSQRGTLVVSVPDVCADTLETNDRIQLFADGSFVVRGRIDNVINSGGVKIQIEEDERLLQSLLPFDFALTSVPDTLYGERVVLLAEAGNKAESISYWLTEMAKVLPRYHAPKELFFVSSLPRTENGKIDRAACRQLATTQTDTKKGGL